VRKSLSVMLVVLGIAAVTTPGWSGSLLSIGGFVQGGVSLTALQSKPATLAAGAVGVSFGKRLLVGLAGDYLLNPVSVSSAGSEYRLGMRYGGLIVGYRLPLFMGLDLTPTALFGIGRFTNSSEPAEPDKIGVIEPEVDVSYSPIAPVALGLGAACRLVLKSNYLTGSEASGLCGVLFLKVRVF